MDRWPDLEATAIFVEIFHSEPTKVENQLHDWHCHFYSKESKERNMFSLILSFLLEIFLFSIWAKDVPHVPQTTFRSYLQCNSNQDCASLSTCSGPLYWISKCLLCHSRCNTQQILCFVTWQRYGLEGKMIHPFLMHQRWKVASPAYALTDASLVTRGTHAIGWRQTQMFDHL